MHQLTKIFIPCIQTFQTCQIWMIILTKIVLNFFATMKNNLISVMFLSKILLMNKSRSSVISIGSSSIQIIAKESTGYGWKIKNSGLPSFLSEMVIWWLIFLQLLRENPLLSHVVQHNKYSLIQALHIDFIMWYSMVKLLNLILMRQRSSFFPWWSYPPPLMDVRSFWTNGTNT